jgi:hypothetical protein
MQYKTTRRLFNGKYQYKLVLIFAAARLFKCADQDSFNKFITEGKSFGVRNLTQDDIDYAYRLRASLTSMLGLEVRVENPWVSVYSNNKTDIDKLIALDSSRIKYISAPDSTGTLSKDIIILPKIDFEFRVTIGKTTREYSAFVDWAETNAKVKLTKRCKQDLAKTMSWGGTYFYITGDNNLLIAKMHLGGSINKVERIIKG